MNEMDQYLVSTDTIDADSSFIREKAAEQTSGCANDMEKAVRLF